MRAPVALVLALLLVGGCSRSESTHENTSAAPPPPPAPADTVEYVARGNEPFWALEVTPSEIVFREPENIDGVRGAYAPPAREGTRLIFRTTLRDSASTPVEVAFDEKPCQDSMSGFGFAYTATARIGDRVLLGCGERRPATPLGDWTVADHHIPGVSAMSDADAAAWHGRTVHYASGFAVFGTDTCPSASYFSSDVRGDSLLAVDYRANPVALDVKPGATVTMFGIRCGGLPWPAPGGVLLRTNSGRMYAVWDGVFFELRRATPQP